MLTSVIIISFILIKNFFELTTKIVFCNVGEGSAIYIRVHNKVDILINAGPNKKILTCLSAQMPFFDRTIEYIFITSSTQSNSHGLVSLLDRYKVGSIYLPTHFQESINGKFITKYTSIHNTQIRNINNVHNLKILNSTIDTLELKKYLGLNYQEGRYKALLLTTVPGRILSKIERKALPFELQNLFLLSVPIYGFNSSLKYDILSLAEGASIVINKQSVSVPPKNLQTLTSHLRALNKKYYISNEKEDVLFKFN